MTVKYCTWWPLTAVLKQCNVNCEVTVTNNVLQVSSLGLNRILCYT